MSTETISPPVVETTAPAATKLAIRTRFITRAGRF